MGYALHNFQKVAAKAAIDSALAGRNDLFVMPTGSGKSIVIAELLKRFQPSETNRVLIVSHVREIVEQDEAAVLRHVPDASVGVCCAGLRRREHGRPITIATVHSMFRSHMLANVRLVIVDEAHLIPAADASMYRKLLRRVALCADGRRLVPVLGFSATPYRLDSGYLHKGEDALFDRIAYEAPLPALIRQEILSPLTTAPVKGVDFSGLRKGKNDLVVKEYTHAADGVWQKETWSCVDQCVALAAQRKKLLVFGCSIRHAKAIVDAFVARGRNAVALHSEMTVADRREAISAYRNGEAGVLVNVNILTTGFDAPDIDCIVLLRPTLSTGLYVQMVGRGMRRSPGKTDCLLLDFAGNIERHGSLGDIDVQHKEKREAGGRPPGTKECPDCATEALNWQSQCAMCGHLYAEIREQPSMLDPMGIALSRPARVRSDAHAGKECLSTQEAAEIIGTSQTYMKQMRHFGTGPKFSSDGGMTAFGWRQIVYFREDIDAWERSLDIAQMGSGRLYRRRETPLKHVGKVGKSGATVEQICGHCGEAFPVSRARLKFGRGKFCSKPCADVAGANASRRAIQDSSATGLRWTLRLSRES